MKIINGAPVFETPEELIADIMNELRANGITVGAVVKMTADGKVSSVEFEPPTIQ